MASAAVGAGVATAVGRASGVRVTVGAGVGRPPVTATGFAVGATGEKKAEMEVIPVTNASTTPTTSTSTPKIASSISRPPRRDLLRMMVPLARIKYLASVPLVG